MAEYLIQDTTLDAIADAINAKTGGSSAMTPAQMVTAIAAIPSGDDTSPYKIAKGTITPASDSQWLEFPVQNITSVLYATFCIRNYSDYISADNNEQGLGGVVADARHFFPNETRFGTLPVAGFAVYNGAFDYWGAGTLPMNVQNNMAVFTGNPHVIFKAGIPIDYVILGV